MNNQNNRGYNNQRSNNRNQRTQRTQNNYDQNSQQEDYDDNYESRGGRETKSNNVRNNYRNNYNENRVASRNNNYRQNQTRPNRNHYDTQDDDYNDSQQYRSATKSNKKTLFIGLSAIGAIALAFGIYSLVKGNNEVQIVAVSPAYQLTQEPFQDCRKVGTTSYVRNKKDGTEGALIGGATGAVAGGIVGNQIHGGGGGTAVGAIVGGATGALVGRDIQRSNQPDYVARKGHSTQCHTAYRDVKTQIGYNVQYLNKDALGTIVTQTAPAIGTKIPLPALQAMAVQPAPNPVQPK